MRMLGWAGTSNMGCDAMLRIGGRAGVQSLDGIARQVRQQRLKEPGLAISSEMQAGVDLNSRLLHSVVSRGCREALVC